MSTVEKSFFFRFIVGNTVERGRKGGDCSDRFVVPASKHRKHIC